jgi:hypothetical protein
MLLGLGELEEKGKLLMKMQRNMQAMEKKDSDGSSSSEGVYKF